MQDPELIIVPIIFGFPTFLLFMRMRFKHQERLEARKAPQQLSEAADARMARLEQMMEMLTVEMERLGEGQRFTTKLLAERAGAVSDPLALQASDDPAWRPR